VDITVSKTIKEPKAVLGLSPVQYKEKHSVDVPIFTLSPLCAHYSGRRRKMKKKHICFIFCTSSICLSIIAILIYYKFVETKTVELEEEAIKDAETVRIESGGIHASVFEGDINMELHHGTITSLVLIAFIFLCILTVSISNS
jgi:hypothetical protein